MTTIRLLLASRPTLLSKVMVNLINHQPDMRVAGELADTTGLADAIRDMAADALILTAPASDDEARFCRELLASHPALTIVALSGEGKTACLYRNGRPPLRIANPSGDIVLNSIREALK